MREATERAAALAAHVHTPPLMSETEEGITGAELEEGREAIVEQTRDTVVAAGS